MSNSTNPDDILFSESRLQLGTSPAVHSRAKQSKFDYVRSWIASINPDPPVFVDNQTSTPQGIEGFMQSQFEAGNSPIQNQLPVTGVIKSTLEEGTPIAPRLRGNTRVPIVGRMSHSEPPRKDPLGKHPLLPPCATSCRLKCTAKLTNISRHTHRKRFWTGDFQSQRTFLIQHVQVEHCHGIHNSNRLRQNVRERRFSQVYTLEDEEDTSACVQDNVFAHSWPQNGLQTNRNEMCPQQ